MEPGDREGPSNMTAWPFFQLVLHNLQMAPNHSMYWNPVVVGGSGSCIGLGIFLHHGPFLHLLISLALTPVCVPSWPCTLHQLIGLERIYRLEGHGTHSSILAWGIPWAEEPGRLHSMGSQRIVHDLVTNTHTCTRTYRFWRFFVIFAKFNF